MTTSVHTNSSALVALQNLNSTNTKLGATQNRISTGLKVQGAKDNAATWAIAQNQRADTSALDAVKTSLNRATSIADVALAAGEQISDIIIQLKEKAVGASDPSASEASKKAYNDEFQALVASITSFAKNATFDGKNILDGSETDPLEFLASADAEEKIELKPQGMDAAALGLEGLSLETDAAAALAAVEEALATSNTALAELGAQAKQIERHTTFVGKLMDSLEVGVGNLVDADLAKESARLQALQVQQQLGTQALSIANQAPQMILSLFQN